jgi:hypothetical protein
MPIPIFYEKENNKFMRILEMQPNEESKRKFILLVEYYGITHVFDLEDRTLKNYIHIESRSHESTNIVKVDCNNNLIAVKQGRLMNIVDLDNIFCQKLMKKKAIHCIKYYMNDEKIER